MSEQNKSVGEFIGTAFLSYVATNADDLVVLMNFFTEAALSTSSLKIRHVFIGQYLGFIIILAVSMIGYGISYALPIEMLGFLGFLPIALGVRGLVQIIIDEYRKTTINIDEIVANDNISTIEIEAIRYHNDENGSIQFELRQRSVEQTPQETTDQPTPSRVKRIQVKCFRWLTHVFNLQTLKITSITLANSADNIAVYAALFSQATKWQIGVYIIIFLFMVFIWLVACYLFINFRPILTLAQKYAHYLVPVVFVGIGIYIIVSSDCFPWMARAIQHRNFTAG